MVELNGEIGQVASGVGEIKINGKKSGHTKKVYDTIRIRLCRKDRVVR